MNKDLEQFENRSDDWLAKQRHNEHKTSAWDIDEGKKIKEYHEENCEAKEIKERHEQIHSSQLKPKKKKNNVPFVLIIILAFFVVDIVTDIIGRVVIGPFSILALVIFTLSLINVIKERK